MFPRAPLVIRVYGNHLIVSAGWLLSTLLAASATILTYVPTGPLANHLPGWLGGSLLLAAGLAGSVVLHELGHALVARALDRTPTRVRLAVFGGTAEGFDHPGTPRYEVLVALGGPAVSAVIAVVAAALWRVAPSSQPEFKLLLVGFAIVNAALAGLNLLPGYPLDGGRVFRALIWYLHDGFITGTRAAVIYGQFVSLSLLGAGILFLGLHEPLAPWGLWLVLVGWSLGHTGRRELSRAFLIVAGSRLSAGETVEGLNPRVRADQPLDEVVEVLLAEIEAGPAMVVTDGGVVGVITLDDIKRARRANWSRRTADQAMRPVGDLPTIDQSATVRDLMGCLSEADDSILLVTDDARIVGAVDRRAALRRLLERTRARSQLRQP